MAFTFKKLLVAFDGSPNSKRAFEFALDLAKVCRDVESVNVISVVRPPEPAEVVMTDLEPVINSGKTHYEGLFRNLQEMASAAGVRLVTEIAVGYPADQIIQYAVDNKCSMIILGRLGKSKVERWILGSVAKQVSFHALCAVTIVQ